MSNSTLYTWSCVLSYEIDEMSKAPSAVFPPRQYYFGQLQKRGHVKLQLIKNLESTLEVHEYCILELQAPVVMAGKLLSRLKVETLGDLP